MDVEKAIGYAEGEYVKILVPFTAKLRGWLSKHEVPPDCGQVLHRVDSLGVEGVLVRTERGNFLIKESMLRPLLRPSDRRRTG